MNTPPLGTSESGIVSRLIIAALAFFVRWITRHTILDLCPAVVAVAHVDYALALVAKVLEVEVGVPTHAITQTMKTLIHHILLSFVPSLDGESWGGVISYDLPSKDLFFTL